MKPGNIVLAMAGKEKGDIFVVVKVDEKFVYLADGKRLKFDKPKKKSLKHVKFVDKGIDGLAQEQEESVNAKFRKILNAKRSDLCQRKM